MIYFTKENKRSRLVSSKISIIVIMIATLMITSTMITGAHAPRKKSSRSRNRSLTCGDGTFHTNSILNFDAQPTPKLPGPSHKLFGQWGLSAKLMIHL